MKKAVKRQPERSWRARPVRRAFFGILAVVLIWALVGRLTEAEAVLHTLARGNRAWVLLAVALQGAYLAVYAGALQAAFAAVGIRIGLRTMLPVWMASLFVGVAAPALSPAFVVEKMARKGHPAARAAAALVLARVADFGTFTVFLLAGLFILHRRHDLRGFEIAGSVALLATISGWTLLLCVGVWRRAFLRRWLERFRFTVDRAARPLTRSPLLGDGWSDRAAEEFENAGEAISARPDRFRSLVALAGLAHLIDLFCLESILLAFHGPADPGVVVAAFSVSVLFWIVAVTPQGIGVVEGATALVLATLGVPAERAAAVALAFRGVTFWLPLALGAVALRFVSPGTRRGRPREEEAR